MLLPISKERSCVGVEGCVVISCQFMLCIVVWVVESLLQIGLCSMVV